MSIKTFILFCLMAGYCSLSYGQNKKTKDDDLDKQVIVVSDYKPTLSDANKINILPQIDDTVRIDPSIEYFVTPVELPTHYHPRPIQSAKMLGVPLSRLYPYYLRLGMGNYTSPFVEFYANSLRSRETIWGIQSKHESSWGKVRLDNDKKVPADYHDSYLNLNAKRIFAKSQLSGDVNLNNNNYLFYGTTPMADTLPSKSDIRQNLFNPNMVIRYRSLNLEDTTALNYNTILKYDYFQDHYGHQQNILYFNADIDKYINLNRLGIRTGYQYFQRLTDSLHTGIFNIRPFLSRYGDEWIVHAGLDVFAHTRENNTNIHYYPVGYLEYIVGNHYCNPFIGVDGKLETNHYMKILQENPWITPGTEVEDADHQLNFYGGFKGNFSSKAAFKIRYSYSLVGNQYFFVNDYSTPLENSFTVVYSDMDYTNLFAELIYNPQEKLRLHLQGNYHKYRLFQDFPAWHKPKWDVSFSAFYNLQDKFIVHAGLYAIGDRLVKHKDTEASPIKLDPYLDFNLGIEYRYTRVLSAFIHLQNFTASSYSRFYHYPTQRFKAMLGISYSFL